MSSFVQRTADLAALSWTPAPDRAPVPEELEADPVDLADEANGIY